jgi:hypothetical protein
MYFLSAEFDAQPFDVVYFFTLGFATSTCSTLGRSAFSRSVIWHSVFQCSVVRHSIVQCSVAGSSVVRRSVFKSVHVSCSVYLLPSTGEHVYSEQFRVSLLYSTVFCSSGVPPPIYLLYYPLLYSSAYCTQYFTHYCTQPIPISFHLQYCNLHLLSSTIHTSTLLLLRTFKPLIALPATSRVYLRQTISAIYLLQPTSTIYLI